jgi:hypothetical protein
MNVGSSDDDKARDFWVVPADKRSCGARPDLAIHGRVDSFGYLSSREADFDKLISDSFLIVLAAIATAAFSFISWLNYGDCDLGLLKFSLSLLWLIPPCGGEHLVIEGGMKAFIQNLLVCSPPGRAVWRDEPKPDRRCNCAIRRVLDGRRATAASSR